MRPFSSEQILYEDNHLFIINKACSQLVQGDRTGDIFLLEEIKSFIKIRDSKPGNVFCGLIHRLDRPCSGIVIFAKTSKALSRMNALFRQNKVQKYYWALVDGRPPEPAGELRHYLLRDSTRNRSRAFDSPGKGRKESQLRYELVHSTREYFLLEIELLTGRHHQIRAQLAKIGLHIRGDLKYGAKRSNPGGGISLHARSISFQHPVSARQLIITADPVVVQGDRLWQELPPSGRS